ncbi:LADA_0E08416g1_1 [Lachancea dasiensis]|uniref:LADA_0E08416g1_1 n=1 Tax=Lachancea dasiensis TaxID=1072105 RepID=A0A1G4JD79_9SACH|nr:LADA_0E08416g1_1 [Lachancea dasiensis]
MEIEQLNYDTGPALKAILGSEHSLSEIDQLIQATKCMKLQLEEDIIASTQASDVGRKDGQLSSLKSTFEKLMGNVDGITSLSKETETTISRLTKDISYLDNAKRNLSQSMTFFQNLQLITEAYFECRDLLACNEFKEMKAPYSLMSGLMEYFQDYKSVEEIGKLMAKISRLQTETLTRIKKSYETLIGSRSIPEKRFDESMLRDGACELLETSSSAKAELIDWSISKLLYEVTEIFHVDDEAGSLENLSTRYVYFKKVLNSFNADLANFFPKAWEMPWRLTSRFYTVTKKDLEILLGRELKQSPSIDLFMGSLQTTLDFEKYIDVKISNRAYNASKLDKISSSFEPYLVLWIQHQESMMNSKILNYMAEDKLVQSSESLVIPSSADLFRTYRSLLSQTLDLIQAGPGRDRMLIELATFFDSWLKTYSSKILNPLLISTDTKIENKEESILYTLLVLNTADYCSTTIRQLEEKLAEYLSAEKDLVPIFDKVQMQYGGLIAGAMDVLVNSLVAPDLAFAWREFDNTDWRTVAVEDYSRYTVTLRGIIRDEQSIIKKITSKFNREMYSWNFMDRVIELISSGFLNCIIRLLRPKPPLANLSIKRNFQASQVVVIGEQLQLDAECLKEALNFWADDSTDLINGSNTSSKRIKKHIDQNMEDTIILLKLLIVPLDDPETYQENYAAITNHNVNIVSWSFVLALKCLPWDLAEWKRLYRIFQASSQSGKLEILPALAKCKPLLNQFEYDFTHVADNTWQKFVRDELGIRLMQMPYNPKAGSGSSMARVPSGKINGNIKSLMSNTGFFNRGG